MNSENIEDDDIANITILIEFTKNLKEFLNALNTTFYDKLLTHYYYIWYHVTDPNIQFPKRVGQRTGVAGKVSG